MGALRKFVNDHPLTVFVVAAYALSWWSIPFANGGILPHGPFLAAVIVLALTKGRVGLAELLRQIVSRLGGGHWLLIGPGLVIAYLLLALGLNLLLGATITNTAHFGTFTQSLLMLVLLGGVWEEPGWTGYALPMLQARYAHQPFSQLKASLLLGVIRAGWHFPLVISGAIPWYDAVFFSMAFQLLITWLFNRTQGGVLIVMLFHLTSNVVGGGIMIPLFSGADYTRYYLLFIAMAWLLAIVLAGRNKWSIGQRSPNG
jgi:hypothetical protein